MQEYEVKSEKTQYVVCGCGDDGCGSISLREETNYKFTWRKGIELLVSNSRFKFLVISFFIAMIGVVLNQIYLEPQWIVYFWWASALFGLIIPIKLSVKSLKKGKLTINTLLSVATISSLILELYEEAVFLVIIFSLGEILENILVKTMEGGLESLKALVPSTVTIVEQDNSLQSVSIDSVKKGQTILVRTGDIVPIDSEILDSTLEVQNAHLTGESQIISVYPGEKIYAGSAIVQGASQVRSIVGSKDSQVHHIVKSVEFALQRKSSAERFSEKFAKHYTPIIFIFAAIIAFIVPIFDSHSQEVWILRALVILVVSCACGLAVSVPVTVISAVASAAKNGILFRGGASIEKIGSIRAVIFDKTGTLTVGKPMVKEIRLFESNKQSEIFPMIYSLVSRSNHPISKNIVSFLKVKEVSENLEIVDFKEIAGLGLIANINSIQFEITKDIESRYVDHVAKEFGQFTSYSIIKSNNKVIGLIAFEDSIRSEAKQVVDYLKKQNIHVVMLTGDNQVVAQSVADELGIESFNAQVLPSEKVDRLLELKEKYGNVAMVGDGINDAPALAEADVSFAMGHSGAEIASDIADIVLMQDNLTKIPEAIKHGRRAFKIAKMNIVLSLITVFGLLLLAGFGFINLISGIIANEGTALLIIINGLRMMKFYK